MTENAKNLSAQKSIQDPPEYTAENPRNPSQASDRQEKAGRMGTGNIALNESTDQQNGQSWLGGPQNGEEIPGNGGNGGNGGNASGSGNGGNG